METDEFSTGSHDMIAQPRICPFCCKYFLPSAFRPDQKICSAAPCQKHRHADYHRAKCESDPEYRQVCLESRAKWRGEHPDYQRIYRQDHPEYVEQNRRLQHRRDRKRRMRDLVKNNLAISQVMLFQTVGSIEVRAG